MGKKKTKRRPDECSSCRGIIESNRVASGQKFCKECQRIYLNNYRKTDSYKKVWEKQKDKHYARAYTNQYVRRGTIKKTPCCICGDENSEIHHDDYTNWRDVKFYCRKHHLEYHKNEKNVLG